MMATPSPILRLDMRVWISNAKIIFTESENYSPGRKSKSPNPTVIGDGGSYVAVQLFQCQPGRVKTIAGRRVYVAFGIVSGDMATIAKPLAGAIVTQFSERYAQR